MWNGVGANAFVWLKLVPNVIFYVKYDRNRCKLPPKCQWSGVISAQLLLYVHQSVRPNWHSI